MKQNTSAPAETPLMKQYNAIKSKYPDALLLFRVGDFYETFGEDAVRASGILGIVLTRRANGAASFIELAGFPHHSLDLYLPRLVKAGLRVAICDQLEDPKLTKTIVKRGVTELVTPGVSYHDRILEQKENNFLAAVHLEPKISGISFLDISTGEFYLAQGGTEYIDKLIQSFKPSEVIVQKSKRLNFTELFGSKFYLNTFDDWVFTSDFSNELLLKHFGTTSLKGFGVDNLDVAVIAAGAALHYLAETQHENGIYTGLTAEVATMTPALIPPSCSADKTYQVSESASAWAAWADLCSAAGAFCVDSTGQAKVVPSEPVVGTIFVCP